MATLPKKTRGRRKIELKRIENEDARYVTFSKRKLSLFKKATELAILCGAEIAIVAFSPAGRPYSIGIPNIDEVFHRVLFSGPDQIGFQMAGSSEITPSTKQCSEIIKCLEQEKRRKAILAEQLNMETPPRWEGEGGLDGLEWNELLKQVQELEKIKSKVDSRLYEVLFKGASSSINASWPIKGSTTCPQNGGGSIRYGRVSIINDL